MLLTSYNWGVDCGNEAKVSGDIKKIMYG